MNAVSVEDIDAEKYKLIDINEIQNDSSPFIATLEQSHWSAKNSWSTYTKKPISQVQFENLVSEAIETVAEDNPYLNVSEGEISAIDAIKFRPGSYGLDVRPKLFDNKTKSSEGIFVPSESRLSRI